MGAINRNGFLRTEPFGDVDWEQAFYGRFCRNGKIRSNQSFDSSTTFPTIVIRSAGNCTFTTFIAFQYGGMETKVLNTQYWQ